MLTDKISCSLAQANTHVALSILKCIWKIKCNMSSITGGRVPKAALESAESCNKKEPRHFLQNINNMLKKKSKWYVFFVFYY